MKREEMKQLKLDFCKELPFNFETKREVDKVYPKDDFTGNKKRIIRLEQTNFCYMTAENFHGHQMFRMFMLAYENNRKENDRKYFASEVYRFLLKIEGDTLFCKKRTYSVFYSTRFDYASQLKLKPLSVQQSNKWNFVPYAFGKMQKAPFLKYLNFSVIKHCFDKKYRDNSKGAMTSLDYAKAFRCYPKTLETLQKLKRYDLIMLFYNCVWLHEYEYEIMSCTRHNYFPKDINAYREYLQIIKRLNWDTKNPKILCPENFDEMNSKAEKIWHKRQEEIERKERIEKAMKYANEYSKRISKYLNIDLGNDKYEIKIIPDIKSFVKEADVMHHCVLRMEYYKKPDSLIFSVKNRQTHERIETAEIYKSDLSLNQLYGRFDKFTNDHNSIKSVINRNKKKLLAIENA